jgi:hypothetical protein
MCSGVWRTRDYAARYDPPNTGVPGDRIEVPSAGRGAAKPVDEPLVRRYGVNFTGRQAAWQRGAVLCVQYNRGNGPGISGIELTVVSGGHGNAPVMPASRWAISRTLYGETELHPV